MLTVADLEPYIDREFGSRLEPLGFQQVDRRKWVRAKKSPIQEIVFLVPPYSGMSYLSMWGISCGFVPILKGRKMVFGRITNPKSLQVDLPRDPIDETGRAHEYKFQFYTGYTTEIPEEEIRNCALKTVGQSSLYFNLVHSVSDFCDLSCYPKLQFAYGFVLILIGKKVEGKKEIQEFCKKYNLNFDNPILSEYIEKAENYIG
jgi:hypothetical protein